MLWDTTKMIRIRTFSEHVGKVYDIKILHNGKNDQNGLNDTTSNSNFNTSKLFISCGEDRLIKIWNCDSKFSIRTYINSSEVYCIENLFNYSEEDDYFMTGDKNKTITIWKSTVNDEENNDGSHAKLLTIDTDHSNYLWRLLHLSKIEPFNLIISASEGDIKMYDLEDENGCEEPLRIYNGHDSWIHCLVYLSDRHFASSSHDQTIRIWKVDVEECLKVISCHDGIIYSILNLGDYVKLVSGDILVSGGSDKKMKFSEVESDSNCKDECVVTEYNKNEGLYRMAYLENSKKFKYFSIDFGKSRNINLYG